MVRVLAKAMRDAAAQPATDQAWAVDASALQHFDSSALAVLLECRRLADAQGRKIRVCNAPAKLGQLARLYGIDELLEVAGEPADQG